MPIDTKDENLQVDDDTMMSVADALRDAIAKGVPAFNSGNAKGCFEIYQRTAQNIIVAMSEASSLAFDNRHYRDQVCAIVQRASDEAQTLAGNDDNNDLTSSKYQQAAWILRNAFDTILDSPSGHSSNRRVSSINTGSPQTNIDNGDGSDDDDDDDDGWQDERTKATTPWERAQQMVDLVLVLRQELLPSSDNDISGAQIVDTLVYMHLVATPQAAIAKGQALVDTGFLWSINDESAVFEDSPMSHYKFATRADLERRLDEEMSKDQQQKDNDDGGEEEETSLSGPSREDMLSTLQHQQSIQLLLQDQYDSEEESLSTSTTSATTIGMTTMSEATEAGQALSQVLQELEPQLVLGPRRRLLRTYKDCFVGQQAITAWLDIDEAASTRADATTKLTTLLRAGLVQCLNCTYEKTGSQRTKKLVFQDKKNAYYRLLTNKPNLKSLLGKLAAQQHQSSDQDAKEGWSLQDQVHLATVKHHYGLKSELQATAWDMNEILNLFFGCKSESGTDCWDVVDLQVWRNNMKRWGFGRPSDQDDDMVGRLSPLLDSVTDPTSWKAPSPEWETPFGILAQIAVFDQVSRSAFRGTTRAFAYDEIAIRASKLAIERGYFDSAYRSTLNQFLVLLPLEHSESWEDQKLGVQLLLRMLSTVAIQDDGQWSNYEIVKRLEFSKRLTTAFLEHAQVVAKFQRFPHRNRALGRSTTLEERIWLASDLVPRWAKSQNPPSAHEEDDDGTKKRRNLLTLPVIPLKRLTKG